MTIDRAAIILGVPLRTAQALAARGQIPGAAKIGRRWTFDVRKLRRWHAETGYLYQRPDHPLNQPPPSLIYFAVAGDRVKIGLTTNVERRLKAIRATCPTEIIVVLKVRGTRATERAYHERFADQRLHGEWFRLDGALLEFVQRCRQGRGLPG